VGTRVFPGFLHDSNVYNLGKGIDKFNGGLPSCRWHQTGE